MTPYAYELTDTLLAGLERWLESMTQAEPRIDRRTTLRHGEEDMAGPVFDFGAYRVAGQHILLMNLAATPEAENHGLASTCDPTCAERRVVGTVQQFASRMSTGVEG